MNWFNIDEAVKLCIIFMISPNIYFALSFFLHTDIENKSKNISVKIECITHILYQLS